MTPINIHDELARYQNPRTKEWWRILRESSTGCVWLESISQRSLERGLAWAYACDLDISLSGSEPHEHVIAVIKEEMERYVA